jgi:hypothetical protein
MYSTSQPEESPGPATLLRAGFLSFPESSDPDSLTPSKAATFHAALADSFSRPAWAEIVSPQLLGQFFIAVNDPRPTLHLCLGRESFSALAHRLEKNGCSSKSCWSMLHRLSSAKNGRQWLLRWTPNPGEGFGTKFR